nr:uncharacterized protein LOC103352463 isoform X8 [Oryctolagus cuniculus]
MTEVDAGRRPCPSAAFLQQPDSFFVLFFLSINQLFLSAVWTVAPFPYRWLLALLHSAGRWAVPLPPFSQGRLQPKPWVSGRSNPEPCSWTEAWMERPSWASLSLLGFAHGRYCCTPKTASRGEEEVTAEGVRGARQGPASHGSGRSFRKSSKEAVVTCSVHVIGSEDLPVGQDGEPIGDTLRPVWGLIDKCYPVTIQRPKIKRGKKQASKENRNIQKEIALYPSEASGGQQ